MEYPDTIRPVSCPRCGMVDLVHLTGQIEGLEKDSNSIVIPVKCMNPECKIKFYECYKFDKWIP